MRMGREVESKRNYCISVIYYFGFIKGVVLIFFKEIIVLFVEFKFLF